MLIDTKVLENGLAVVALTGDLRRATALNSMAGVIERLNKEGRRGIFLDLDRIRSINMAGLAALVELAARYPKLDLAFCALPEKQLAFLRKSGLDRGLMIFDTVEEARNHEVFQEHSLRGVRTVLLCAGRGSRVAPLTEITPKPMLDVAGRPILHRIIDHLETFGLRDILLNPGHLGHQIIDYFRGLPMADTRITFANEGRWTPSGWLAQPVGSASTLKRMQVETAAFDGDVVVLCGDALIDLNFAEMMREHRESGADATIAALTVPKEEVHKYGIIETGVRKNVAGFFEKPKPGVTESRLANTGIYIFKSDVLALLDSREGLDIACDLLPAILANGGNIHVFDEPFAWVDIGCGRDYAVATAKCLGEDLPFAHPIGEEIRPGVWAMPGAEVSKNAHITGPCHIGANARVEDGAHLEGVCSVGEDAVICEGTVLRHSMVMQGTSVNFGAWADHMIINGDWAVDHTRADGKSQERAALDCVSFTNPPLPDEQRATA